MNINVAGCEWMKLAIVTEPATTPAQWEASIDDGATYVTATDIDGTSAWLTAGPDYTGVETPDFVTTGIGSVRVQVRLIDAPETVIRTAPRITTSDM